MQKEEFPTFLNEQPTIIFGRTGRELLILAIGAALGYACWMRLGAIFPHPHFGILVLKAVISILPIIGSAVVALVTIAGRPLEEWAFAGLFYFLVPKVYIYLPPEETLLDEAEEEDVFQVESQESDLRDNDY